MSRITIVEVAPRDGLQNEARSLDPAVRADLVRRSIAAGARRVEAVSFVNPARVPQMAGAADVLAEVGEPTGVSISALVLNRRGLDDALVCGVREIDIAVPCTDGMSERNQGVTVEQMLEQTRTMIDVARAAGAFTTVTIAVAFGCPFDGEVTAEQVRRVIDGVLPAGPDELAFADTIGVGVPRQVRDLVALGRDAAPDVGLRFHFHNTRNTGYANALAAVEAGVTVLDASIGGFGGCPFAPGATGNIGTEDLIYALERSGYQTGIDGQATAETARWLSEHLDKEQPAMLGRAGPFPRPS